MNIAIGIVHTFHQKRPRIGVAELCHELRPECAGLCLLADYVTPVTGGTSLKEAFAAQKAAGVSDAPSPSVNEGEDRRPSARSAGTGRRQPSQPLITIAKAEHKEEALAGLERWKDRFPDAAALLEVDDVLVDAMRGRWTAWWRIRINLRHVPEDERPAEEAPDPDYDPWRDYKGERDRERRAAERSRNTRSSS